MLAARMDALKDAVMVANWVDSTVGAKVAK